MTYFAAVRAVTGDGTVLDSFSDGFTVDTSPPSVTFSLSRNTPAIYRSDVVMFKDISNIEVVPHVTDDESGVSNIWIGVGSFLRKKFFNLIKHLYVCDKFAVTLISLKTDPNLRCVYVSFIDFNFYFSSFFRENST